MHLLRKWNLKDIRQYTTAAYACYCIPKYPDIKMTKITSRIRNQAVTDMIELK